MDHRDATIGLREIGQIAVPVADLGRSVTFYRDVLGMRLLFQAPPGLAFFDCSGVRLMLDATAATAAECRASVIYFKVADIAAAHAQFSASGAPFEAKPHRVATLPDLVLWMAFFRDPDRNLLALMCEVRG